MVGRFRVLGNQDDFSAIFAVIKNLAAQKHFAGRQSLMRSFFELLPQQNNPPIQLGEDENCLLLRMLVPGIAKDQLNIELNGQILTISGQITPEPGFYHRQERPTGFFSRTLRLGARIAAPDISARLQNGVLTLRLPKARPQKTGTEKRRIKPAAL